MCLTAFQQLFCWANYSTTTKKPVDVKIKGDELIETAAK